MRDFDAQTQVEKLDQLWDHITAEGKVGKSASTSGKLATVKNMVTESMITAFDDEWEVLPNGRSKVIHRQGVHCKVTMGISSDSPYTGVLAPGNHAGVVRLGSAASLELEEDGKSIFPGYGIKFPRTGMRSASWVGLRAAGSGGSRDFFADVLSNHVAPSDQLIKLGKFQQASACIDMVGLSEATSHDQEGKKAEKNAFPFELLFEPTGATTFVDEAKTDAQLLAELAAVKPRTRIFDVFAYASPKEKAAGRKLRIGSLTTASECVPSLFGDEELFIRHTRMEEDFIQAPHWVEEMKALGEDPACLPSTEPISTWQCSAHAAADEEAAGLLAE